MDIQKAMKRALRWTAVLSFGSVGVLFGLFFTSAFQNTSPTPTSTGTTDANNDSKKYPFFTVTSTDVYDRATMSFQAIAGNFSTLISDTTTLKTNTNTANTRVNLSRCVNFPMTAGTTCPAGWTYTSQVAMVTGNSNLCCK